MPPEFSVANADVGTARSSRNGNFPISVVTVAAEQAYPFFSYALELASRFLGIKFVPVQNLSVACDIYYGNDRDHKCRLRIPRAPGYDRSSIPAIAKSFVTTAAVGAVFPFDLFEAIRFWLTDIGNEGPDARFDEHERLRPESSAQYAAGALDIPVVNSYLLLLRTWLEQTLHIGSISTLPHGKSCVVILTHDADEIIDSGDRAHWIRMARASLCSGGLRRRASNFKHACRRLVKSNTTDRYWGFQELMRLEERYDVRSTLFFSSVSFIKGDPLDNEYEIRDPKIRTAIRELRAAGFEIGLHISYAARGSGKQVWLEKRTLEKIVGDTVEGCRHHYWHMTSPMWRSLESHEAAGLKYDSSVAFNDAPGFRLGIAYPFYPWSPIANRAIGTIQIPTMLMDGAVLYDPAATVESVLSRVEALIHNLKTCNGVAAIDWHVHTSFPGSPHTRRWAESYAAVLQMITSDREIATLNVRECLSSMQATVETDRRIPNAGVVDED